jgi:23S rRNA pseudouridine2604 synthase
MAERGRSPGAKGTAFPFSQRPQRNAPGPKKGAPAGGQKAAFGAPETRVKPLWGPGAAKSAAKPAPAKKDSPSVGMSPPAAEPTSTETTPGQKLTSRPQDAPSESPPTPVTKEAAKTASEREPQGAASGASRVPDATDPTQRAVRPARAGKAAPSGTRPTLSLKVAAPTEAEAPRVDAPRADKPRTNTPRANGPGANGPRTDAPRTTAPRPDAPRSKTSSANAPRSDSPRANAPRTDVSRTKGPRGDAARTDSRSRADTARAESAPNAANQAPQAPAKTEPAREKKRGPAAPRGTPAPWHQPDPAKRRSSADAASASNLPKGAGAPAAVRSPPAHDAADGPVRVSKLMAERGMCSRREADAYIERGLVFVDGERVTELGTRARPDAKIKLAPEAETQQARQATILLHKPVGYVSGQPEPGFQPAVVLIRPETQHRPSGGDEPAFEPRHLKGLAPAGRLDIDSTGLLVLTQDGRIARQLIGEDSEVEKEYLVRVEGELIANGLALLNHGLSLDDKPLRPAKVEWLNDDQLRFVLKEGKKRQIRRMCELVGLKVTGLKRVRMGNLRLGDLPVGKWRYLKPSETF